MKTFRTIWSILNFHQRKNSVKLLVFIIISMLVETIGIGMIIPIVAVIMEVDIYEKYKFLRPLLDLLGNPNSKQLIFYGITILILVFLIKNIYLTFFTWWQNKFSTDIMVEISKKLFSTYLSLPFTFHLQTNSAKLIRNLAGEVLSFQNLLQTLIIIISEIFILIGIVIFLLIFEFQGTIAVVIFFLIAVLIFNYFYKDKAKRWSKDRLFYGELATKHMIQGLSAIKEMKVLGRENEFIKNYINNFTQQALILRWHNTMMGMPRLWIEVLGVLVLSFLVYFMVFQNRNVNEIISLLALYAVASFRLMPSITRIINSAQNIMYFVSSAPVLASELEELKKINYIEKSEKNMFLFDPKQYFEVSIKGLNFSYPAKNHLILSDIAFNIKKGECLGITGESGSGKTTLMDILLGLLEPKAGSVKINGKNFLENIKSWQSRIGYVPQTLYLTDDSIKNNIAFGLSENNIDLKKINNAIELAQLTSFINELDDGIESIVGEKGIKLSGGQRQRIAIARALYHTPEIIMMDEATSALDNQIENELMKSIFALKKDKTIIIIAHRYSTIQNCDRIIQMKKGKIIKIGKPEEILNS